MRSPILGSFHCSYFMHAIIIIITQACHNEQALYSYQHQKFFFALASQPTNNTIDDWIIGYFLTEFRKIRSNRRISKKTTTSVDEDGFKVLFLNVFNIFACIAAIILWLKINFTSVVLLNLSAIISYLTTAKYYFKHSFIHWDCFI